MPDRPTIAVLPPRDLCGALFSPESWERLTSLGAVVWNENERRNLDEEGAKAILADVDVCITSWGSPVLTAPVVAAAPKLRLLCHGAGTVKPFVSDALWQRGIIVTSTAAAIAVSVADAALAWIIIGARRFLWANATTREGGWKNEMAYPSSDFYDKRIGIIGASHVGRRMIELLREFRVEIVVYDPYLAAEEALKLGARKVELDELLRTSDVVSIHAPNTAETRHMLDARALALLQDGATLVNTARGAIIDEAALAQELTTGRIWAILDVTDPEPPAADHPFRRLPNITLTPHIAGCTDRGRRLIGEYVVEEVSRFIAGKPQRYAMTREMLARIG